MKMTKIYERKILNHGKSFGVSLPKKELERQGFKPGDVVDVEITVSKES